MEWNSLLFYDFHKFFNSKQTKKVYIKKKKIAKNAQKKSYKKKSLCVRVEKPVAVKVPESLGVCVCVRVFGFFRLAQGENK